MNEYEIMVKDMETAIGKALGITYEGERLPFSLHTRNCLAKDLVNAGYRKVADDEMVIKKSEYEDLRLAKYKAMEEATEYEKTAYKQLETATQETVREVLQEVVNAWNTGNLNQRELAYICTKHGIKVEDVWEIEL